MPRQLGRAHRLQAVVGEVVGLEGVDAVEALEVVMRMRMTWMMRCWRVTGACTWMVPGHRDVRLTMLPSHPTPGHVDSAEHTSCAQAGPRSPPPTQLSPPLFSGFAHDGGYIFVPTLGWPTPPVVQAKPTLDHSLPNPDEPTTQIEQIQSENIEPVHGLRRSLPTDVQPP
nr:hypothetical protein CFP56_60583 [Quercus suber]